MTAKELKQWMETVPDCAMIECRERSYGEFAKEFQLRALLPVLAAKAPDAIEKTELNSY